MNRIAFRLDRLAHSDSQRGSIVRHTQNYSTLLDTVIERYRREPSEQKNDGNVIPVQTLVGRVAVPILEQQQKQQQMKHISIHSG